MGTGSAIAHRAVDGVMGPRQVEVTSAASAVPISLFIRVNQSDIQNQLHCHCRCYYFNKFNTGTGMITV
jgi:hypothetical protein